MISSTKKWFIAEIPRELSNGLRDSWAARRFHHQFFAEHVEETLLSKRARTGFVSGFKSHSNKENHSKHPCLFFALSLEDSTKEVFWRLATKWATSQGLMRLISYRTLLDSKANICLVLEELETQMEM